MNLIIMYCKPEMESYRMECDYCRSNTSSYIIGLDKR
jgi:hypothetical protein